jgi:hypothetical protein
MNIATPIFVVLAANLTMAYQYTLLVEQVDSYKAIPDKREAKSVSSPGRVHKDNAPCDTEALDEPMAWGP